MTDAVEILSRGPATSAQIQREAQLSQSTVSRQLSKLGDLVVRLGTGRSTRYALACNAFGAGNSFPVISIDQHGNKVPIGYLRPLAHGGYCLQAQANTPSVLLGVDGTGEFDGLPFFLDDLRPQGFLGRQLAAELSGRCADFPANPTQWNAEQVGRYLVASGDDLPGNLMLGQQHLYRALPRPAKQHEEEYPELADAVLAGSLPGSSAGGEQPKFTAYTGETPSHVIVKFSPKGNSEVATRWRDILIT